VCLMLVASFSISGGAVTALEEESSNKMLRGGEVEIFAASQDEKGATNTTRHLDHLGIFDFLGDLFNPNHRYNDCANFRHVVDHPSLIEFAIVYNSDFCHRIGGKRKTEARIRSIVNSANHFSYHRIGIHIRVKEILGNCGAESEIDSEISKVCVNSVCRGGININQIGNFRNGLDNQQALDRFRDWWRNGISADFKIGIDGVMFFVPYPLGLNPEYPKETSGLNGRAGIASLCDNIGNEGMMNAIQDSTEATTNLFSHEVGHLFGSRDLPGNTLMGNDDRSCWHKESLDEMDDYLGGVTCLATHKNYDFFIGLGFLYPAIWSNYNYYNGFGMSERDASNHFQYPGIWEDRIAIPAFDPLYYYENNSDLKKLEYNPAFLLSHWLTNGINEGRTASAAFDPRFYLNKYRDLRRAFTGRTKYYEAVKHWLAYLHVEGRQGSSIYDPKSYLNRYVDLRRAFGPNNYRAATRHWLQHGKKEGRRGAR